MVGKAGSTLSARMMVHSAKNRALSNVMSITMDLATSAPIKPFYTLRGAGHLQGYSRADRGVPSRGGGKASG